MNRRQSNRLILLCAAAYFASYVCRINLSATLVEVTASGMASTRMAALALTLCSITYGAGQIISGWLGDRVKPQNLMFFGFGLTGAANLCVALMQNGNHLPVLWAVNGFAQAMMWPPMTVIMSACLTEEAYEKGVVRVCWGSSFGTVAVYLLSPLLLLASGVRSVFLFSAFTAFAMLLFWLFTFRRTYAALMPAHGQSQVRRENSPKESLDRSAVVLIAVILLAIILQGILRDGVTSWMPTLMADTFHLSSSLSILTGVILPLFSLICYQLPALLKKRWFKNDLTCAAVIFAGGGTAALALYLTNASSMIVSLLALAVLAGSMHSVNLVLICFTPRYFAQYGRTGLISGVLNSATYLGSALSGYGLALFSEAFGWHSTIGLWALIALSGMVICLSIRGQWQRFTQK